MLARAARGSNGAGTALRAPAHWSGRLAALLLLAASPGVQGCAHAGAPAPLPAWVRIPAEQRGTTLLFTGEGDGASEAEARGAALRAAREEAARARNVRVESELRIDAGQIAVRAADASAVSWQRVVTATRETTEGVLTRAVPYDEAVVVRRGRRFSAWARIAVEESDLFPWLILQGAMAPDDAATRGRRLRDAARELEAHGEVPLAELALREAAEARDSDQADGATVDLAWLLQRQGREVEALRLFRAADIPGRLSGSLRESAAHVARLLTPEHRRYEECTEELLALTRAFGSAARLRLRLVPPPLSVARTTAPGTPVAVDLLLDIRDRPREVAALWIDTMGVRLEFPSPGSAVPRGAHALSLAGARGLGEVAVVVIAAGSLGPLERLRSPGQLQLVSRWRGDGVSAADERELLAFQGLTQAVGMTLRADSTAAAAQLRLRLD